VCLPSFILASSISEIVNSVFSKNYELKSIEQSINIATQDMKLSSKYQNPILSIGVNDIYFDEPFTRDKEAMQASYIGISQTFQSNDKLRLKEEISFQNKKVNELILEDKKAYLQSLIYKKSWNILVLQEKKELLKEYLSNLAKLKNLNEKYYELGKTNQNDILNLSIKISQIELKINTLENKIENLFVDLKSISYLDIKTIDDELSIDKLNVHDKEVSLDIQYHPKLKILNEQIQKELTKAKLEDEKKFSDFKVSAAYFSRDDKFKDYANISVSMPLGINDRENIEIVKAKLNASKLQNQLQNLKDTLNSKVKNLKNNMQFSIKNIDILEKQIIPLNKNIQQNIENYVSLNEENYQKLILNLNKQIEFKQQIIDFKKEYFNSKAELIYLSQGLTNDKK
jgi:outer membrane protein TolC